MLTADCLEQQTVRTFEPELTAAFVANPSLIWVAELERCAFVYMTIA